jgi:hypothetical protein
MTRREVQRLKRTGPWVESGKALERTVFFSDAVFAIAITLLVLDIRLPEVSEEQLRTELPILVLGLLPQFLSFVITFLVIGFYWLAHHRMFDYIEQHDGRLQWINLLFLMSVAFLPFPTSVLSTASTTLNFNDDLPSTTLVLRLGIHQGGQDFAVPFYAASALVTGLLLCGLWWYAASGSRLVSRGLTPRRASFISLWALIPPLVFGLSIGISFVSSEAAQLSWMLIPLILLSFDRIYFRRGG